MVTVPIITMKWQKTRLLADCLASISRVSRPTAAAAANEVASTPKAEERKSVKNRCIIFKSTVKYSVDDPPKPVEMSKGRLRGASTLKSQEM